LSQASTSIGGVEKDSFLDDDQFYKPMDLNTVGNTQKGAMGSSLAGVGHGNFSAEDQSIINQIQNNQMSS